jgi:hypothetical protein
VICKNCDKKFKPSKKWQRHCSPLCAEQYGNRSYKLKKLYGIDHQTYNKMFAEQNGCCRICLEHQTNLARKLAVDHCHTTGQIRGLLCTKCNQALGLLNDDSTNVQRMMEYLS